MLQEPLDYNSSLPNVSTAQKMYFALCCITVLTVIGRSQYLWVENSNKWLDDYYIKNHLQVFNTIFQLFSLSLSVLVDYLMLKHQFKHHFFTKKVNFYFYTIIIQIIGFMTTLFVKLITSGEVNSFSSLLNVNPQWFAAMGIYLLVTFGIHSLIIGILLFFRKIKI